MSKTDRSVLDFFILALMADGVVVTPYTLLQRLGISPGASIPALRRLERQELTQREKAGPRRRQAFILTRKGKEVLQRDLYDALPELEANPPLDAESLSRIAALGRSGHANRGTAIAIVEAALTKCIEKAKSVEQHLQPLQVMAGTADIYTWALANMELIRWKSQAVAIRKVYYSLCTKGYRLNKGGRPERRKTRNRGFQPPAQGGTPS